MADTPPEVVAARREREALVMRMRTEGATWGQIASALDLSQTRVQQIHRNGLALVPLTERVEEFRALHEQKLNAAIEKLEAIIEARHPLVSHGRLIRSDAVVDVSKNEQGQTILVVEEGQGEALEDDGPVIAALAEMRKQLDSFSRVIGAAAPTKIDVQGEIRTVHYDIGGMPNKEALT